MAGLIPESVLVDPVAFACKIFGGFKVLAGLVGSPGAELPGGRRIFENLQEFFLRQLQKMQYSSIFSEKVKKPRVNFSRVWTNITNTSEFLINFPKFSKTI